MPDSRQALKQRVDDWALAALTLVMLNVVPPLGLIHLFVTIPLLAQYAARHLFNK